MTVKECYECLGADYEDVSCRLRSEERILKFLKMVLKDTSFKDLCDAMEEQDYEKAFRAVHTLKGVLLNLGLTVQGRYAAALTEALRGRQENEEIKPLFTQLVSSYGEMCSAIKELAKTSETGGIQNG